MRGIGSAAAKVTLLHLAWQLGVAAGHGDGTERARTLTKDDFDQYLAEERSKQRPCLVMFHVSWCKVCQRTFPKFANASDQVAEKGIGMDFAHVDCTNDKTLCQRYAVKGYPTIKLFPAKADQEPLQFRSQRSEAGFVRYAERMTLPPVRRVAGPAELDAALLNETFVAFVAAVPSDQAIPAGLAEAAERWRDRHVFAVAGSLGDLLPKAVAAPKGAVLAALSTGAQQWPGADNTSAASPAALFFQGDLSDPKEVLAFVEQSRFPGVWQLDETNFYEFTHSSRRAAMVAVDPQKVSREEEAALRGAAARLGADFLFGVLDGNSWAEELTDFNIAKQDLPRVLVTEDDFEVWIEDIDELRLETLEADLKGVLSGQKSLLRQSRSVPSKLQFYLREVQRNALRLYAYAKRGHKEAAIAAAIVVGIFGALMAIGWCAGACCKILIGEDPADYDSPPQRPLSAAEKLVAQASRSKRD